MDKDIEKVLDILTDFTSYVASCHKRGYEPNLNPWADLLTTKEAEKAKREEMAREMIGEEAMFNIWRKGVRNYKQELIKIALKYGVEV